MRRRPLLFALAVTPMLVAFAQEPATQGPKAEEVYKNIQVLKGLPASEVGMAMQFMASSLKLTCAGCHDLKDFSIDTPMKKTAREMILMQRDINAKHFNGRNEVTCMTCHHGSEHPLGTPVPDGISLRHKRIENPPKAEDLISKYESLVGNPKGILVRTGTITAPNDGTEKIETTPIELTQSEGGKFQLAGGDRKIASDGAKVTYNTYPLEDEPAFLFTRIAGSWRTIPKLDRASVSQDTIGKTPVFVVRGANPAMSSTQEFWFDAKSGLLDRIVNARRSALGTVVTMVDFSNYRAVAGVKTPMKIVATLGGVVEWNLDFRTAKMAPG